MLSTFGTLNGSLLTSPRVFFAMADDGLFFRKVAAVHPRFEHAVRGDPARHGGSASCSCCCATFEQLADTFVTAIVPVLRARRRVDLRVAQARDAYDPPFRTPLYPIVPALFILATLFLLGNAIIDPSSRWPTLAVLGIDPGGDPGVLPDGGAKAVNREP